MGSQPPPPQPLPLRPQPPPHDDHSMLNPTQPLRASWSKTLHLPKSALPARPPLPSPYLQRCSDDLYAWQQANRPREKSFVLHDGPPYANGALHIGHALNKILKDIVCRFQVGQGRRVHYVPGWDCHGLPIEVKALQALKVHHDDVGPVRVRQAARQLAEKTVEEQKKGFREWAVMGDWDAGYKTMDREFEMRQLGIFKEMVERGLVYRMRKPVYWSASSGTALAEAELEYDEGHRSTAAFIRFPIFELSEKLRQWQDIDVDSLGAVIWTTTPWTLPANEAIAINSGLEYSVVALNSSNQTELQLLVASSRLEHLQSFLGEENVMVIVTSIPGADLIGTKYLHPLRGNKPQPIIEADFVSSESGSGLVHLAPGHGMDDYNVCTKLGLPISAPVDDQGKFTADAYPRNPDLLQGKLVQAEGTVAVLDLLNTLAAEDPKFEKLVLDIHEIRHKYPIDWRTKQPVIVRATEQWFADVEGLKQDALHSLENVKFIPDTGKTRLESFTQSRSQWCISRQRAWGVPIPALYRTDLDKVEAVMTVQTIDHIMKVIAERGIDSWWTDAQDDPAWVPSGLEGSYVRGRDTMDVWFDSGTSWTLLPPRDQSLPLADVYLEGSDQHRGWFQSSLLTHIAHEQTRQVASPKAPFKTLITHGFTLDQDGRKMSKSIGNVIAPSQITDGSLLPPVKRKKQKGAQASSQPTYDAMGPDILRLWVASSDYTRDVVIGQPVLQSVHQSLHKYRVTFKWLLGALSDYDPKGAQNQERSPYSFIDSMAEYQLSIVSSGVHAHYNSYEFFKAVNVLNRYVNLDLSALYFETVKDRLYTGSSAERVSAQAVLYKIFDELLSMLGPITPLLVEEIWDFTPSQIKDYMGHPLRKVWEPAQSPKVPDSFVQDIKVLMDANTAIKSAQEELRAKGKMGSSLECDVHIMLASSEVAKRHAENDLFLSNIANELPNVFVVSKVFVYQASESEQNRPAWPSAGDGVEKMFQVEGLGECKVFVTTPSGEKCARCWRYLDLTAESLCGRCDSAVRSEFPELLQG